MEQILNNLSEIEATANAIMQDAARQKQALSEEAEKQIKDFDASLETKTSAEIQKIREDLAREKDARITQLRAETEDQLSRLDAYYEAKPRDSFQRAVSENNRNYRNLKGKEVIQWALSSHTADSLPRSVPCKQACDR